MSEILNDNKVHTLRTALANKRFSTEDVIQVQVAGATGSYLDLTIDSICAVEMKDVRYGPDVPGRIVIKVSRKEIDDLAAAKAKKVLASLITPDT